MIQCDAYNCVENNCMGFCKLESIQINNRICISAIEKLCENCKQYDKCLNDPNIYVMDICHNYEYDLNKGEN